MLEALAAEAPARTAVRVESATVTADEQRIGAASANTMARKNSDDIDDDDYDKKRPRKIAKTVAMAVLLFTIGSVSARCHRRARHVGTLDQH